MSVSAADRLVRILEMKSQPGEPPRTIEDDLALLKLLREQHAEIQRLRDEIERAFDSGYDKGVQDTLLDYGVEP